MNPFSLTAISSLLPDERANRLRDLEVELCRHLAKVKTSSDFLKQASALVQELRNLGHDLWSFDADDDFEIWCGDWTKGSAGGPLVVTFRFPVLVYAEWRAP